MFSVDDLNRVLGNLIPIIAIIAVFGMPIAIVIARLNYKAQRNRMMHETIQRLAEKGLPVPPELLTGAMEDTLGECKPDDVNWKEYRKKSPLRSGIILIAVGIGLTIMFLSGSERLNTAWGIGMIPLLLGIGYLVIWKLESRNPNT